MANLIASTYELIERIGSGGGANVYLANHVRLNKKVALKADKRKITARPEALRREVDVLKNLSHTYIPQVYDFFVENETVYTAMEFVEGESLDRSLDRGETYSQAQVIKWAIQLLEALSYLHSPIHGDPPHGFVHSDIKPANIMRTPQNDIRLIDFNIALAMGEGNIVGRSAGYASPEHYGIDFSSGQHTETVRKTTEVLDQGTDTLTLNISSSSSTRVVIPDARSDIYSVGATLYHLLSGERPRKNAVDVVPLSRKHFSSQICDIIKKAMNPNPDLRYQTADEMLYAFTHLYQNDPRNRWFRIVRAAVFIFLAAMMISGTVTAFIGLKRMQTTESWLKYAEYSQNALDDGNQDSAIEYALKAFPEEITITTPKYISEAEKSLADALGVYDLSDGYKSNKVVELPSETLNIVISPGGDKAACLYSTSIAIIDTANAAITATLPTVPSAMSEMVFIDDKIIVFAGEDGVTAYDTVDNTVRWVGRPGTAIALSADGRYIASVYRNERFATIYECATGEIVREVSFGEKYQKILENDIFANPNDDIFALNNDGSLLAVSFFDGSLQIFDLNRGQSTAIVSEIDGFTHFSGGFSRNYFAYTASNLNEAKFCVHDTEDMELLGQFTSGSGAFSLNSSVQTDEYGIYLHSNNVLVNVDPATGDQIPQINTSNSVNKFTHSGKHTLVVSDDKYMFFDENAQMVSSYTFDIGESYFALSNGTALIGGRDSAMVRVLEYENHSELNLFTYDPYYDHTYAHISADGSTLMLYDINHFRLHDKEGNVIADVQLPDPQMMYDQQYIRDENGSRMEVTYLDGRVVAYSAVDGTMLYEKVLEEIPNDSDEVFYTKSLRIESPVHGAPVAYDVSTGEEVAVLSSDDLLINISQVEGLIVAQYLKTDGSYYGMLMNEECEVLAKVPCLRDVLDGQLILDYPTGCIRASKIYELNELLGLASENKDK